MGLSPTSSHWTHMKSLFLARHQCKPAELSKALSLTPASASTPQIARAAHSHTACSPGSHQPLDSAGGPGPSWRDPRGRNARHNEQQGAFTCRGPGALLSAHPARPPNSSQSCPVRVPCETPTSVGLASSSQTGLTQSPACPSPSPPGPRWAGGLRRVLGAREWGAETWG